VGNIQRYFDNCFLKVWCFKMYFVIVGMIEIPSTFVFFFRTGCVTGLSLSVRHGLVSIYLKCVSIYNIIVNFGLKFYSI